MCLYINVSAMTGVASNRVLAVTPACWQVDQALVEVTSRVRLHSERSRAGEWARVSDDSEVRGVPEQRITEVSTLSGCSFVSECKLGHILTKSYE